jgi:hypothetical protein
MENITADENSVETFADVLIKSEEWLNLIGKPMWKTDDLTVEELLKKCRLQEMKLCYDNVSESKEVSAFGLQDIDEYRFVGYTFDNHYGFAIFKLNENGDYIFERVKKADKMIPRALDIVVDYHNDYWIAISNNENLNTIQFKTKDKSNSNDKVITVEVTDCPSISVIKLPYEDYFESGEYNFYDDISNLIK